MTEISACLMPKGAIDTHAHVFHLSANLAEGRRYTPTYSVSVQDYLRQLDNLGLANGVLIQPSFLGYDNSQLTNAIKESNGRCKGVCVIAPNSTAKEIEILNRAGIKGVRLNLFGQSVPDITAPHWSGFLEVINSLDWHVELHCPLEHLKRVADPLLAAGCRIVVDHFGRPSLDHPTLTSSLAYLYELGQTGRTWVKLSAGYRVMQSQQEKDLTSIARNLRKHFGCERLMWGSDWPHTQHESQGLSEQALRWLFSVFNSSDEQEQILVRTPHSIFNF